MTQPTRRQRVKIVPSVSSIDNGKVLSVVNGAWAAATPSGGSGDSSDAVLYTQQSLDNTQKTQARANIGAGYSNVSVDAVNNLMMVSDARTGSIEQYFLGAPVPMVTASDNGKILKVVNGQWAAVTE